MNIINRVLVMGAVLALGATAVAQNPCVVDDNGTGTVTLPPIGCDYLSPEEVHMIIDGLPPGTTIELDPIHMDFICGESGDICSLPLPPGECEGEGGSLGGNFDCFESTLDLTVTGTGNLEGFNRHLAVPISCEVHTGPRNPGDPVQTFPNDMYRLQGELFGDPDFCTFRVTGGTDYGLPGPGETTLTDLGDGTFNVDSFFDITYQIEFEGCPGSQLADLAGTTTAIISMATGTSQNCEPTADGSACEDVVCPGGSPSVIVNQPPNQITAYWDDCDYPQVLAEDFNLNADQTIAAVRFWGLYVPGDGTPPNNWTIKFYEDATAAHLPGTEVYTYTGPGVMAQTGAIVSGMHEWEVIVSLPSPHPVLSVGSWWVAAYTDSAADPNNDWAWETGNLDPTAGIAGAAYDVVCPPTFPTLDQTVDLAFELITGGDVCVPRCVNFDPATGATSVVDCECRPLGDCHVEIPPSSRLDPCEAPDNGTGTITLPPIGCEYLSPEEVHMIIDGLPPGTTIELDPIHMDFICGESVDICSLPLPPGECEGEGGSLGGNFDCFESTLDLTVSGTGDLAGFNRHLAVPISCEVHTGPRNPGDPVQTFPNDMYRLQGELFGDPDFCTFRVTGGTDYGLPGPGETTLTELPSGDFAVDSFFDITYQIEFEGCPGSQLADLAGTTTAALLMRTPPRQPPTCVGGCPTGTDCVETVTDLPDGTVDICCDCVPLECEPTPDGSACESVSCPIAGDECQPACVEFDTVTGETTVTDCECRPPDECHVDLMGPARQDPCVVADNGTGTITLPPEGCEYLSPEEVHEIIDGLPPGTTIELNAIHLDFLCTDVAICSLPIPPGECEVPGGSLGGHGDCFESTLYLTVTGTGDLAGFNRELWVPISCEVHTGPRNPGDPVQTFPNDMYRLQGELFGDPDFCTFRVTGGTDFGLPSPGQTTLTDLGDGTFAVDSFFDITYQIEFEGCPDSQLADYAGTTTATIRMRTPMPSPPTCAGGCPAGEECVEEITDLGSGQLAICCTCQPIPCEPTADGSACQAAQCPVAGDECQPACVEFDTVTGETIVTDCECRPPDECHVDLMAPARQDPCIVADDGTGTITLPPIGCDYLSPEEVHMIIDGLPPGTTIELDPIHMDFICGESGDICSLPLPPGECEGEGGSLGGNFDCFESTLDLTVTGTGNLEGFNRHLAVPISCEVHTGPRNPGDPVQTFANDMYRLQGELFGDPDFCTFRVTGGTDFGLPGPGQTTLTDLGDGTFAVDSFFDITYQIEFEGCPDSQLADLAGTTTATLLMRTLMPAPPTCTGGCPAGEECVETITDLGGGQVEVCCDCQPIPCGPTPDGSACEPAICPEADDICQPECVNFDPGPGQTIVTDCACVLPDECHVDLTGPSRQDPCVVPDNGTGTITLPPEGCDYLSPEEVHMIIDGLPPGTTIELDPIHMDFLCYDVAICSTALPPGECEGEGGSLGGNFDCFDSTLDLTVTGTGDLTGFNRHLAVPISCEVHTGPRNPGDPVQTFPNEMYRLQGELFGDPDFCTFRVLGGVDFGLPGPGQTTLTQLPSGDFAVDSFFDITYQIEFEGCPDSQLADYAGTTTATIRMETTVAQQPTCVGDCLADERCLKTKLVKPDETIDICCQCRRPGDCDADYIVGLADYLVFWGCITGPGGGLLPGCECADLDEDVDVDLKDFSLFQEAFD